MQDLYKEQYPLSNACGQLGKSFGCSNMLDVRLNITLCTDKTCTSFVTAGQSYQDYNCAPEEEHMQCPVDPEMQITATTHAHWYVLLHKYEEFVHVFLN